MVNEGLRYSVGGGYFGQDGVIKNSDFNRASFRSNLDIKIVPNFTLTTNITASHTVQWYAFLRVMVAVVPVV